MRFPKWDILKIGDKLGLALARHGTLISRLAMAHLLHGILYCVMVHMGATGRGFAMDIVRLTWWYLVCITTYLLP